MIVERNLLISALKLTKTGPSNQEDIKSDAKLPSSVVGFLLRKLQSEGLIYVEDSLVKIPLESRMKLAVKALQLRADVQQVSDLLAWQEFESMASVALEFNGYSTIKNVRFKNAAKRWEIDVVGCKKPLVICIDCKQWHQGMHVSSLRRIAEAQSARVAALAESLPDKALNLIWTKWDKAVFVPVILSLINANVKFCDEVPIVPVLALQDFIHQLPLNLNEVKVFSRKLEHL